MPDLLLELFSEEIPARMQRKAADDLRKLVTDALVERGFLYEGAKAFATPRRLALTVHGLPAQGQDVREERKGPRANAPAPAVHGFLKSIGVPPQGFSAFDTLKPGESATQGGLTVELRGEGDKAVFFAHIERPGRPTLDVLAEILPGIIRAFPWPKSMRWGAASRETGSLRWVRPLQSILALFGPETEDPEIVPFEVDGLQASDVTYGHRFLSDGRPIKVRRFDDYVPALERAKVVLDADRRKDMILHDARDLAFAKGLELVEDEALLEEVAGLVEWPVVLMGSFDPAFLDIPAEVIRATIRANQKCFVTRTPESGRLAEHFILVSNLVASDGGKAIVAGNERVVRARLSDARHFWEVDRKPLPDVASYTQAAQTLSLDLAKPLDQRMAKLAHLGVVFHEKLGTQGERVQRIVALARELAPIVGADPEQAARAAVLAKADLTTELVGEFPEVQGLMGRTYAALQGEDASVCAAIEEHYKPLGPSDRVPTDPVSVTVALADKLDTLVGFWAIDEKPTGSKDPYALRRAALGVIRLVVENGVRLELINPNLHAYRIQLIERLKRFIEIKSSLSFTDISKSKFAHIISKPGSFEQILPKILESVWAGEFAPEDEIICMNNLLSFFHDRLKVMLRDQGTRADLVDAVLAAHSTQAVMPGLVPGIHALPAAEKDMDGRDRPGHDDGEGATPAASPAGKDTAGAVANDDLLLVVRRVEALTAFLATPDGASLIATVKRAANILKAEEKKDGEGAFDAPPDLDLIAGKGQIEEKALAVALDGALSAARAAIGAEDYAGALAALAALRPPVDAFFETVTVNAEDADLRRNRLRLLAQLRAATRQVADFALIQS